MRWRQPPLEADVRERLDLGPKERILAWVDDGAGRPVVASEAALHVQRVPPEYSRLGWEQIERASYDSGVLTVVLGPELGTATLRIPVGEGRDLPVVVRDRVTASVVVDRFVALDEAAGVRIVGRRGADRKVTWRLDLDPGLEASPEAVLASQEALAEAQAEVGDV